MGGVEGRQLHAGDRLSVGESSGAARRAAAKAPLPHRGIRVRVLPGPQRDMFDDSAFELLQRTRFVVTPQSNRMGYRLAAGVRFPRKDDHEMISDAAFTGGLQVPPSGEPILLMADRPTTGGYPQIAIVITADIPLAAQLAPGDWVEFEPCSPDDALTALRPREARPGGTS
jgi:allophanate hydrolase subunit 2